MKASTLLAAGLLVASFSGTAVLAATPVIRISGAATYRSPILKGIEDILQPGYGIAYNGSARYKATASIYSGTLTSTGQAIIIKTYFTGDLAGAVDLTQQNNITQWIDSGTALGTNASPVVLTSGGYTTETAPPQASVTVSFATSSAAVVATAGGTGATAATKILNTTLTNAGSTTSTGAGTAGTIGIAAFQWVVGKLASGYTVPFTNITQAQANSLINDGSIPVAFLTGSNTDLHNYAVLVGRSEDAGARTVPFAEAQTGFGNAAYQYALTFSNNQTTQADGRATGGAGSTVTGADLWPSNAPLNTEPTINWNTQGHSGYNLTSDLSNVLSATNPVATGSLTLNNLPSPANQVYFVGYNGVADTATLVAAGGTALSYNGVPYSAAAVQNGQYSLWSFAHLYYIGAGSNQLVGTPQQAANDLGDKIFTTDADINSSGQHSSTTGAGIFFNSSVVVTRSLEGGTISQTY